MSEARSPLAERPAPVNKNARLATGGPLDEIRMFFVYILQSIKDSRTYVGHTNNTPRRLDQHNKGMVKSTKHRSPFRLLYEEKFLSLSEAKQRENWWKSGAGRKRLKDYFTKGFPKRNNYE